MLLIEKKMIDVYFIHIFNKKIIFIWAFIWGGINISHGCVITQEDFRKLGAYFSHPLFVR